ncbi:MAG: HAMP domain-containing sensor histidine kinase [Bacteroidetes bacterium]|nr:HAMP domain-containing sensor histidine kinase [Bacteroidota bacterium]
MLKPIHIRVIGSILILIIIILIDYNLVSEITLAIFYMIPIIIFSYQNTLPFFYSLIFSFICGFSWSYVDYLTHPYSEEIYRIVNGITRIGVSLLAAKAVNQYFVEKLLRKIIYDQKEQLEIANAELNASQVELNKFIGMAAHDIRNPVGSIKMIAEMYLTKEGVSEEARKWIQMVETAANNSLQILNDTLNISKIQSGTIDLNKTKSDYIKFINDSIVANQYLAINKNQKIVFESDLSAVEVNFDGSRLSQVFNNLLTNAIKYSNTDTTITVKVNYLDNKKDQILTSVIDQGLGIDEKYHATLFVPFTTTANKPTSNESSTGLGLAIVKRIVELHKGTISFTSEKGKGSNFFFTIPIA